MTRRGVGRGGSRTARDTSRGAPRAPAGFAQHAGWVPWVVAGVLLVHACALVWAATRNSVTFDESFHVPAGVVALARGDFSTSYAQPPLARSLYGVAALAAGARLPDPGVERPGHERELGESFMRRNADRFERVYFAARLAGIAMCVFLAWWILRRARARWGSGAALVALVAWCGSPEALAHGSLAGVDLPTALALFGAVTTGVDWLRSGRWRDWAVCAAWVAAAFLVRFSAGQAILALALIAAVLAARRRLASPGRTLAGFAAFGAVAWVAVAAGYRFEGLGTPLGAVDFLSPAFQHLAARFGHLPSPLPVPYLRGLDYITYLAQPGIKESYFQGDVTLAHHWRYFPVALSVKWPLALLALLAARLVHLAARRGADLDREAELLLPAVVVIGSAMLANLDYGVRYVLPALPFLCVWVAGLAAPAAGVRGGAGWRSAVALGLALLIPVEAARSLPYPLSFFNAFASAPGVGERIVNDSNVDWGQGLIALRDEMKRRGIRRVHLAYHGTVDPAVYGIDYVPHWGGVPGPEADWLVMSSYFYVGLSSRVLGPNGYTPSPIRYDARGLYRATPVANPARCLWMFRVR